MSLCYIFTENGVKMTQKQLVADAKRKILADPGKYPGLAKMLFSEDVSKQLQNYDRLIAIKTKAKTLGPDTHIGTYNFIKSPHKLSDDPDAPEVLIVPVWEGENYLEKQVEKNKLEGLNPDLTRLQIELQIKDMQLENQMGTIQHSILEAVINSRGNVKTQECKDTLEDSKEALHSSKDEDGNEIDNGKEVIDVVTANNPSLSEDQIVGFLQANALEFWNKRIKNNPEYEDAKFITECLLYADGIKTPGDKHKGIKGIADLIIVKKDGSIEIIDFKVCTSSYSLWCAAKLYHTEYQLGIYRAILEKHGFDGSKIKLFVLPIFLNRNNAQDTSLEPIQELGINSRASGSTYDHLDYKYGSFMTNIRYWFGLNAPEIDLSTSIKINDESMDLFYEMVDYRPAEKNYTKEELIANRLRRYENGKGETIWRFYDMYEGRFIKNKNKEFFTREGGYIDIYYRKMKDVKNSWVLSLTLTITKFQEDGTLPDDQDFLNTKGLRGSISQVMTNIFGEFTKPEYDLLKIPALLNNGIMAFLNKNSHTIHFITLTDLALSATYANGKYGSILGNFLTNDEVRHLNRVPTLLANTLNAESIKTVHLINMIAKENPEYFAGKLIGSIRVINPALTAGGENNSVPMEDLLVNYQILCDKVGIKNNFNSVINLTNPWEELGYLLTAVELQYEKDLGLKTIVKSYKANTMSAAGKVNLLIKLRILLEKKYPRFQLPNFIKDQKYDFSNPIDALFVNINLLIMYYQNIPIDPAGNYDKYGLRASSILDLLGVVITPNSAFVDKNGLTVRGIGSGLYITSAENSPSPTLRALAEYYEIAYSHVREDYSKLHDIILKITLPYISKFLSKAGQLLSGVSIDMWERLLVKNEKGEISDTLMLKNPYEDPSLDEDSKKFLKAILWEINKYRFRSTFEEHLDWTYEKNAKEIEQFLNSNTKVIELMSGRYFELPLKKARYFERWRKVGRIGLKDLTLKEFDNLSDDWNITKMHNTRRSLIARDLSKNATTMYNQYDIHPDDRAELISKEGVYDFELDLDLLALDVAFQSIRQDYFENVLQTTAACATMLHVTLQLTGTKRGTELEALEDRVKSSIKGESTMEEEKLNMGKVATALRKLNSLLVLSFRPLLMIKEITFGLFTNYSRVLGLIGSADKITMKNVFLANKIIWGQSIGKWCNIFTSDAAMGSYTLCERLNKIYAIANEDISRTVEGSMQSRFGILANLSKWMYMPNSAPDYYNRMTLFIAKMMEDGCWEAHSLDKDGKLIYDFKKDSRFSELNKYGLNNPSKQTELYKLQKALYIAMAELFEKEGRHFIEYKDNGNIVYKEFDRAYTNKERNSIKEVSDLAYGYYDHEIKSLMDLGFFGLIYKLFQTFLTAKVNLWFRGRSITKGDNTALGKFIPIEYTHEVDGKTVTEKCYRRLIFKDNKVVDVKIVPESELTPEEVGKLDLAYEWQGDYVEGLFYSLLGTLHDLFHLNFKEIANNKYRLGNLALALHDLLIGMLLFEIFKWLFSGGSKKMQDIKPLLRVLLRSMLDVSPAALTSISWEPGFWSSIVNLRNDAITLFSNDDPDIAKMISRRVGAIKDWTWNDID